MNDAYDNAKDDRAALEAALEALETRVKSRPCLTCSLPATVREILEADRRSAKPHSFDQLSRFLATRGYVIAATTIAGHFRKGHAK